MADQEIPAPSAQDAPVPSRSLTSPEVTVNDHDSSAAARPAFAPHASDPPGIQKLASPMRHHKRTPSAHREVKETLDARVEFLSDETDGRTHHRINQFVIQDEIGRGSFGSVHLGTDQFGTEYAIKEFSKVRLRKRAQSEILKQGPHRPLRRAGLDAPLTPYTSGGSLRAGEKNDALYLIREEIAIMKKLNHPNLVQLIEVLDDPEEDSLYMVMEMCKKGVVMKVGLDDEATPYDEEQCRHWFRDLILGIEYLHAQGVIHRDIKPDNLLLSDDNVLKVVDFGVSQMFERPSEMRTAKSAGSPAFLPPELCGKHGDVSGQAADIWSMGVSLFCLKYGRIPFNRDGMMQMYEAIKNDEPTLPENESPLLSDLFSKIFDKDPETRIKMDELRNHPWVTNSGTDSLLPAEENCAHHIDPPNELELAHAFTRKMNHLLCVMKVLQRFKAILARKRAREMEEQGLSAADHSTLKDDGFDPAVEKAKAEEIEALLERRRNIRKQSEKEAEEGLETPDVEVDGAPEPLFLGIGTGSRDDFAMDDAAPNVVADSPTAVDFNVYDRAYEDAVEDKLKNSSHRPTLYLTRFVKDKEHLKHLEKLVDTTDRSSAAGKLAELASTSKASATDKASELATLGNDKVAEVAARVAASQKLADLTSKIGLSGTQDDSKAKPSPEA